MHLKLGDVGKYRQFLDKAVEIFSEIEVKLSCVEKSVNTIQSALQKIKLGFKSGEEFESEEQSIDERGTKVCSSRIS